MSPIFLVADGIRIAGALQWGILIFRISKGCSFNSRTSLLMLFFACVTGYLLTPLSLIGSFPTEVQSFLFLLMFSAPVMLWLVSKALFEDSFSIHYWQILLGAFALLVDFLTYRPSALYPLFANFIGDGFLGKFIKAGFPQINTLLFAALALHGAHYGKDSELVETRLKFRKNFILATSVAAVAIAIGDAYMKITGHLMQGVNLLTAALVFGIGFTLNSSLKKLDFLSEKIANASPKIQTPLVALDEELRAKLQEQIEIRKFFLDPSACLTLLASKLNVPEYRLRQHINQTMGFQNFNQFLNFHRISEAKKRLLEDAERKLPIYNLAVDLGYGSAVSFNRAFKESTGKTPTQFRDDIISTL